MDPAVKDILQQVSRQPYGNHRLSLCQEAERIAGDDEDALFHVRLELCSSAVFSGQPQLCLIAYSWCLAFFDRESKVSTRYAKNIEALLWRYKFCLGNLPEFASVSLEQIGGLQQDSRRRMDEAGYSLRGYHMNVGRGAFALGDLESVKSSYDSAFALKRDSMSDCRACEINAEVEFHAYSKQWDDCIKKAQPLMKGVLKCQEVPNITWPYIAKAYLEDGDFETAADILEKGVQSSGGPNYIETTGQLIEGFGLIGDYASGIRLFESRFFWTNDCVQDMPRFHFYAASAFLLKKAMAKEGAFRLRLSEELLNKCSVTDGDAAGMVGWLEGQSNAIAAKFDKRNGNLFWSHFLQKLISS